MTRRSRSATTAVLLCATMAVAVPVAEAGKRRGVQRHYTGARWAYSPKSLGWAADLRLDKASVRDARKGGFISQTLWAATNSGKTKFGKNRRTPYLSVSVTRGWRGKAKNTLVVAQRTTKGRYYEGKSGGPGVMGRDVSVSIAGQIGGVWTITVDHEKIGTAKGLGDSPYSQSAFAGIESSSSRNKARGAVKEMFWIVNSGNAAVPFPRWRVGDGDQTAARLVRRGGRASVRWTDKHYSLRNSFGR